MAWAVGQDYGNLPLTEKHKFRRHDSPTGDFSSWVWSFPDEEAFQMSSCTSLITALQAVTALITVLIITSSRRPTISWAGWHSPAKWGWAGGRPCGGSLAQLSLLQGLLGTLLRKAIPGGCS